MNEQRKLHNQEIEDCRKSAAALLVAFPWVSSPDGRDYWKSVHDKLTAMAAHGTSDGKPYVEPIRIPTDEDAKQRPMVMVRDCEDKEWQGGEMLIRVSDATDLRFITESTEYPEEHVTHYRYCRFPTEAESKEMGQ